MYEQYVERERMIQWYDQYSAALFKYINKMVKDAQQAEDLTQETFIKAYSHLSKKHKNQEIKHPKAFLYRIAHNLTVDFLRKRRPLYIINELLTSQKDPRPPTETIVEIREESKELHEALQSLKPSYRQVIMLRKIEAFSTREVAHILNWKQGKVKATLHRGLRALENECTKRGVTNETSGTIFS